MPKHAETVVTFPHVCEWEGNADNTCEFELIVDEFRSKCDSVWLETTRQVVESVEACILLLLEESEMVIGVFSLQAPSEEREREREKVTGWHSVLSNHFSRCLCLDERSFACLNHGKAHFTM